MILSDQDITKQVEAGKIQIDPFSPEDVQPCSYDLHLGSDLLLYIPPFTLNSEVPWLDPRYPDARATRPISLEDDPYILKAGSSVLGATAEIVGVPNDLLGRIDGKSSLARLLLQVHTSSGFVDPGWTGRLTLELTNHNVWGIRLEKGMPICQINFMQLSSPVKRAYGSKGLKSKYQGSLGVEGARAPGETVIP